MYELRAVDDEVRGLADALEQGETLTTLTATGLVATCTACGRLMGTRDRFCPSCGAAAGSSDRVRDDRPEPMEPPDFGETQEFNVVKAMAEEDAAHFEEEDAAAGAPDAAEPEGESVATRPEPIHASPQAQALVPRAQRRMRAGRRMARQWLAQRRSDGP